MLILSKKSARNRALFQPFLEKGLTNDKGRSIITEDAPVAKLADAPDLGSGE